MEKIRVLLADDQVLFVQSLKTVLDLQTDDIEVVGIAGNGREAVEAAESTRPHVVLMDVRMPGMDGVEAARIIHQKHAEIQIIMLTTFDDDNYVYKALSNGAAGYLLKDIPPSELIASIRAIREGPVLISPSVAAKLADHALSFKHAFVVPEGADEAHVRERLETLSRREREVFRLIAEGFDNREISEKLFIAEQTVKNHVSAIYSKFNVRDRVHMIRLAMEFKNLV
jgi:DNA-binding NarL/FixJ family response regulator